MIIPKNYNEWNSKSYNNTNTDKYLVKLKQVSSVRAGYFINDDLILISFIKNLLLRIRISGVVF